MSVQSQQCNSKKKAMRIDHTPVSRCWEVQEVAKRDLKILALQFRGIQQMSVKKEG